MLNHPTKNSPRSTVLGHNTRMIITDHLDEIKSMFDFPVTITIIIRSDEMPNGEDIIITSDDLDQVVGAIMRRGGEGLH
jgi:hypothetical protein